MPDAFPSLTVTTSSTTGTGALVLDTADRTDYLRTPKRAVTDGDLSNGDNVYYNVVDKSVTDGDAIFEVGYGAYNDTANTITRTAGNVISGSNGPGALVSLPGSGVRDVLILDHIPNRSSQIAVSNALRIEASGGLTINDDGESVDFRVESNTATSMLKVVGASNRIGINQSGPIAGTLHITQKATDTSGRGLAVTNISGAGSARLWVNGSNVATLDSGSGGAGTLAFNIGGGSIGFGTAAPATDFHLQESSTDTMPAVEIEQLSTGDAALQFSIAGDAYAIGIDNSDGDKFKISYASSAGNAVLGTNDRLVIDSSGNVEVAGNVTVLQSGGTPGADEVVISHDGNNGSVATASGQLNLEGGNVSVEAGNLNVDGDGTFNIGIESPHGAVLGAYGDLAIRDGMSAPSNVSGWAKIYVDSADGDLKVKFGDGTVKTIVVDT